jgi:hypothetical protein
MLPITSSSMIALSSAGASNGAYLLSVRSKVCAADRNFSDNATAGSLPVVRGTNSFGQDSLANRST